MEEECWGGVAVFRGPQPACRSPGSLMHTLWKTEREGTYAEEDEKLTLPPTSPKHILHIHTCPTDRYTTYANIHHTQYIHKNMHIDKCAAAKYMVCAHTTHNMTFHREHYMYTQTRQTHSICTCTSIRHIYYLTHTIAYAYTCMYIYLIQHNMQTICTCYMHIHLYHAICTYALFTIH